MKCSKQHWLGEKSIGDDVEEGTVEGMIGEEEVDL